MKSGETKGSENQKQLKSIGLIVAVLILMGGSLLIFNVFSDEDNSGVTDDQEIQESDLYAEDEEYGTAEFFKNSIERSELPDPRQVGELKKSLAVQYASEGNSAEALQAYLEAEELIGPFDSRTLFNVAYHAEQIGESAQALDYYRKSLDKHDEDAIDDPGQRQWLVEKINELEGSS